MFMPIDLDNKVDETPVAQLDGWSVGPRSQRPKLVHSMAVASSAEFGNHCGLLMADDAIGNTPFFALFIGAGLKLRRFPRRVHDVST